MTLTDERARVESMREELLERFVAWLDDPRYPLRGMTEESQEHWRFLLDGYPRLWRALHHHEEQTARTLARSRTGVTAAEAGGAQEPT